MSYDFVLCIGEGRPAAKGLVSADQMRETKWAGFAILCPIHVIGLQTGVRGVNNHHSTLFYFASYGDILFARCDFMRDLLAIRMTSSQDREFGRDRRCYLSNLSERIVPNCMHEAPSNYCTCCALSVKRVAESPPETVDRSDWIFRSAGYTAFCGHYCAIQIATGSDLAAM